jgi:hypothetical protein
MCLTFKSGMVESLDSLLQQSTDTQKAHVIQ